MAKINTYRLKDGITAEDLDKLGFKSGSWQGKYKNIECMSTFVGLHGRMELNLTIRTNSIEFDDFEDALVLDDVFGQPYTAFYGKNYKGDVKDFPFLEKVINRYNNVMGSMGIFDIVK